MFKEKNTTPGIDKSQFIPFDEYYAQIKRVMVNDCFRKLEKQYY